MGQRTLGDGLRATLFMGGVASVGLNAVVTWPVLGRTLSNSEVGQVSALLAISALLVPLISVGLNSFAIRFIAGSVPGDREVALRVSCTFVLAILLPASVAAVLISSSFATSCVLFILAQTIALVVQGVLRGDNRPALFFAQALATQTVSLIVLTLMYTQAGLNLGLRAASLVIIVFSVVSVLPVAPIWRNLVPSWPEVKWALNFSLPVVPHLVLVVGILQGMRVLIAIFDGHVALSNFQFGALIGGAAITVVQAFGGHLGTDVFRLERLDLAHALGRMLRNLLVTVCLLMLGIVVFRWTVFELWLPPEMDAWRVTLTIAALLPAALVQAIGDVHSAELMHSLRSDYMSWAMVVGSAAAGVCFLSLRLVTFPEFAAGSAITIGLAVRAVTSSALLTRAGRLSLPSNQKWMWCAVGAIVIAEFGILAAQ